jgi:hypothetical protein
MQQTLPCVREMEIVWHRILVNAFKGMEDLIVPSSFVMVFSQLTTKHVLVMELVESSTRVNVNLDILDQNVMDLSVVANWILIQAPALLEECALDLINVIAPTTQ